MDIEKIAKAIEADAGEPLEGLREGLKEAADRQGRVTTPEQILVRVARKATGLTQAAFAEQIQTPLATLQDWEQGRFTPPGAAVCLLRLIAQRPAVTNEIAAAAL